MFTGIRDSAAGILIIAAAIHAGLALLAPSTCEGHWTHLGKLDAYELKESMLTLKCGGDTVRLHAVNAHVIRVSLAPGGKFGRDFSWAVIDGEPRGEFELVAEDPKQLVVSTGAVKVIIHRVPCRIEFRDKDGNVITADDPERGMGWQADESTGSRGVKAWQQLDDWSAIYGLGEKTGGLNKRGRSWVMWNTDAYGYGPASDPIYKSIPFFLKARDGRFHGIFFDNPWRTYFDFGHEEFNTLSFGADGGELNYYIIAGPHPRDVIKRYTDLTGRTELPPKWALGYHQCRYSYYPESRIRELAKTFRDKKIPCDALYFDINYMDGYRCFTWNDKYFPDPGKLMDDLHAQGFYTVAIIDPAIKHEPGYGVFDSGTANDVWMKRPDGEVHIGRVWPGDAVFPDFTAPKVRKWWGDLYAPFLESSKLDGIWNDMNEPADFNGPNKTVPVETMHDNEGEPAPHSACHNIYGMQMVRATMDGIKRARPGTRPLVITRAMYAGSQRYGATWTGDNTSNWEHLRMSVPMVANLGVSGIPLVGPDIGGFVGGATPELYARWIQVGSLFPFCRTHTGWGNPEQEPWSYGPDVEAIARRSIERRYELMPYLYTLMEESTRTGMPMLRPVWLEFPWSGSADHAFMLGPNIHVVPTVHAEARDFNHWLPPGAWFDVHTGLLHQSGDPVPIDTRMETLPMFVRAGAIIPMQSVIQSTREQAKEPLIIDVWPFGESTGTLYEDDGASYAYREGDFRRSSFKCIADDTNVKLTMRVEDGSFKPAARRPLVRLHGIRGAVQAVRCERIAENGSTKLAISQTPSSSPDKPGAFMYDEEASAWLIRMMPDEGGLHRVLIKLAPPVESTATSVRIDFSDLERDIVHHNDLFIPTAQDNGLRADVHSIWDPFVVLRRLDVDADRLSRMRLRASSEHASKLVMHFSNIIAGKEARRSSIEIPLTPDGTVHEYVVDLKAASEGRWTGRVYTIRLDFEENVRPSETIQLESLLFEPQ
ncbi:MAG: glycoside hydrolase family 31 protein [Planctomycetota bacterium]|jgi:alpha-glucosidase